VLVSRTLVFIPGLLLKLDLQQDIPWIVRKVINFATVQLYMKQDTCSPEACSDKESNPITTIHVTQIVTPGRFNSQDTYILDSVARESTVPIFGKITVAAKYVSVAEIEDAAVRTKFEADISIVETVRSIENGWETTSIWGIERIGGERYYVRYSLTKKGDQDLRLRLVYDFVREFKN